MTTFMQGKDGKFQGSIGTGKKKVPTASSLRPATNIDDFPDDKPPYEVSFHTPDGDVTVQEDGKVFLETANGPKKLGRKERRQYKDEIHAAVKQAWADNIDAMWGRWDRYQEEMLAEREAVQSELRDRSSW